MSNLNPEKALVFRITHVSNIPWILANGLHCSNGQRSDPNYVQIGNGEIIVRRAYRTVPVGKGGNLSDYVPFYFTPFSPMLLNIKTGRNGVVQRPMGEISIIVSSLREIDRRAIPFVFTDRHAVLETTQFYDDLKQLHRIDWTRLQNRDFRRDPDDPGKFERYQAEALIHRHVPVNAILGIIYQNEKEQRKIESTCDKLGVKPEIHCKPDWYF